MLSLAGVAAAISGCTGTSETGDVASGLAATSKPTTSLEAPAQNPPVSGPRMTFDPCLDVTNGFLQQAGLSEAKIKRWDFIGEPTSMLGCDYTTAEKTIMIRTGNDTYENQLVTDGALRHVKNTDLIKINGREGFIGPNRLGDEDCTAFLRTDYGYVVVNGGYRLSTNEVQRRGLDVCGEILRISTLIEPLLPR
ncbi:DUF3558 domain-containing protein [Skermania sp. ID1734]|uniref:DUF3558 domain-containing protein n=1 Tax=Skermania sp. ID1734 TaxID=2597516 RepID=UPI00163D770E|nr:DUF3558 domain-containing protein [Skermania sp. ID1734]